MKISVVMPCLDEEQGIVKTLEEIPVDYLKNIGYELDIIVVDGGSRDRSVELARSMGAEVITSEKGYGRQYRLGFGYAKGDIIVTGDSDGTYPLRDLPEYLSILEKEDLDFISVNRFRDFMPMGMKTVNVFGNRILTCIMNQLFGLHLKDSQSGMWIFRKRILDSITLTSNGMSLSEEIKLAAFSGFRSREIPGDYRPRIGDAKLRRTRDGLSNLAFLVKKRLK